MNLSALPVDCLSHILSLTCPRDVVRSSVVSKHFHSASVSDTAWDKFLPSDCSEIISQTCSLPHFASKRDLVLHLCRYPILFNDNTQSFALDKWTGKKCYMLGARELKIAWGAGDTPWYWMWRSIANSRFPEAAELNIVCWLEIKGRMHTKLLSPDTTYGAYIVFKLMENHSGFIDIPVDVTVLEVDQEEEGPPRNNNHTMIIRSFYMTKELPQSENSASVRQQSDLESFQLTEEMDGWR